MIYEPAAEGATSFVDIRDIADVALAALITPGHDGKIYMLTGPAALIRDEIAAALTKALGKPVAYIAVDDAALRGALAGAPPALVELMSALYGYVRQGYTAPVADDIAKVTRRQPREFAAFAADHVGDWR